MNLLTQDILNRIEHISHEAGAAIMDIYSRNFDVTEKDDHSPLTEADIAANNIIVSRLSAISPSVPILSEEGADKFAKHEDWGRYWLVDPLDGTREFVKRNGEFTVNIALVENGRPVMGVVYAPVPRITYLAAKGLGAFKIDGNGNRQPIKVNDHRDGANWNVVGSRSHAGDSLSDFLQKLGSCTLLPMGSSLKFCLVAEGTADVYPRLGPTSLWDTAAAQCVVEQAGGKVIQLSGQPLSYAHPQHTLNPHFIVHGNSSINWGHMMKDLQQA